MISPNLAGLLVALAGGAFLYRRFKKSPPPTPGAPRALPWRGIALTLLLAVFTATGVAAYNLSAPAPALTLRLPDRPMTSAAVAKAISPGTRLLLSAVLVREADRRAVAVWESEQTAAGTELSLDLPYTEESVPVRLFAAYSPEGPELRAKYKYHSFAEAGTCLLSAPAYCPHLPLDAEPLRKSNLFSLLTPGGDFHLLCFITPAPAGISLLRKDAQTVVDAMDWLRAAIRATDYEDYIRQLSAAHEDWRARPAGEERHYRSLHHGKVPFEGVMLWFGAFGWAAPVAFGIIPACLAASAKRMRALKFVGWVGAMLLLAVASERLFMANAPVPESAHRLFTEPRASR